MTRGAIRRVPCDSSDADARLEQAEAFAVLADLVQVSDEGPTRSAAVSNAVLAGIAACDAICCRRIKQRSAGSNHRGALALLNETPGMGQDAGDHLRVLLSIKSKAQYEVRNPTVAETKRALRAMRSLIRIARAL